MTVEDPYEQPSTRRYECRACLTRIVTEEFVRVCPNCGGRMRNVAVPRE